MTSVHRGENGNEPIAPNTPDTQPQRPSLQEGEAAERRQPSNDDSVAAPPTLKPSSNSLIATGSALNVLSDSLRRRLGRLGSAAPDDLVESASVPGTFPRTGTPGINDNVAVAESTDLDNRAAEPEPVLREETREEQDGPRSKWESFRPSIVFATAATTIFAVGFFRWSYGWALAATTLALPVWLREVDVLSLLGDRRQTNLPKSEAEIKGKSWPLETIFGPLHVFRRCAVFFVSSQLVFAIGAFRLSYAWALLVMLLTIPVWLREGDLEALRIRHQTQEAVRREKLVDGMSESADWLNFALNRYWQQFEPFLSRTIIDTLNASLRKYKPAMLHSLEIVECTLGTRSPRITEFKTWSRGENNVIRLQTGLSFVPPTTTDMADWIAIRDTNGENSNGAKRTKEGTMAKGSAIPPERMPRPCRLVLAVRVGRGNVKIPVLIELSNVIIENFELVVTIDLNSEFPHLQSVNIALPEAARKRTIDFALRPLMALDLISIPGLHQAIESAIDNALKGTLGALDENGVRGKTINIAKKPERDQIKEPELALGVLRCRMIGAMNLRPRSTYKAVLKIGDRELMSTVAINDRGSPQWNQVMDVPLSALTFANSEGWPGTDTLVIEVQDTDVLAINNKPLRTKPLRLREWLNAAKGFGPGVTSEEAMAQLPGGSEERKIVQAWGLPLAAEVRSKKLYDPSNSLGLRDKPVSDAMIPQIQIVLRYFSLEDLAAEAKITWPVPKERQGLVTIRIHNAVNLKDTTSLIPSFDQDPNAAASVSTSASGAAVAVTNTVMGVAKGVLNVATSGVNTFTSLVTGTFEPYVAVYDAEWDSSKSAWKEGRLRFQTPPVLAATGDPVWECTRQILSENVDDVFLMIKVSSKMDLGGTSLPVGKCVISLKEALAIKDEFFGLWWPLDGEGSGRIRIGFEFAPLQLPIKELTSRSDVHEMLSADVHMMPDYDFRRGATLGMSDGTEYVSLFDGIDQGVSKFAQKPMTATVGIAKDLAATPLAMGGRVAEEMKGTFGKIDNLFHSRKKSNGTIFSSVLDEIESADVAVSVSPRSSISEPSSLPAPSPSKSKSDLIKELLPAGELTVRFVECRDLIPPEGESSVSPFIRVYNKDGQALLKSDTIKKSANPIFQDATLVIRLKEGEAPVYQFVVYHDYALRKSPELGSAVLDFRKLYAEHVRSRGAQYDSTKAGITVFEQVLALLKPNEPHKGSEAGRCRINVTFKRGN